ncbi:MAG: LemA family protein [Candidatus Gribaldobacteria bacterium]|nr:LemA family protein [Candidatus Gribaldobacteria bacterium]
MDLIILGVIGGVIVIIALWLGGTFNALVGLRNRAKEAWSDISVQLKRRYDLIPNLVETVKGYASHEKQVFENVTNARAKAMSAQGVADQAQAENALSATLKSLFAVSEAYPDLKASVNSLELQRELTNTKIESVPSNVVAGLFSFKQMDLFELESPAEKNAPQVKF